MNDGRRLPGREIRAGVDACRRRFVGLTALSAWRVAAMSVSGPLLPEAAGAQPAR